MFREDGIDSLIIIKKIGKNFKCTKFTLPMCARCENMNATMYHHRIRPIRTPRPILHNIFLLSVAYERNGIYVFFLNFIINLKNIKLNLFLIFLNPI
jgi:hypothetical protein